jgi:large subunit ribosomal protein L25
MAEQLHVQLREDRGKHNARRLRRRGQIPAVLYGHGQKTVTLSVPAEEMDGALRHGSRLVKLAGAVNEQAFIRDLQWDTWGTHVLHVDFTRVSEHEKVTVTVPIELRGEAPGIREGGVVKHLVHELEMEVEATAIPEKLYVNVNQLNLGGSIRVADLELPPGAKVFVEPETAVVECSLVVEQVVEEVPETGAEPEVIGRKKEEAEEQEE